MTERSPSLGRVLTLVVVLAMVGWLVTPIGASLAAEAATDTGIAAMGPTDDALASGDADQPIILEDDNPSVDHEVVIDPTWYETDTADGPPRIDENLEGTDDTEEVIVRMTELRDMPGVDRVNQPALEHHAEQTQGPFLEWAANQRHVEVENEYWIINGVRAIVDFSEVNLEELTAHEHVESVGEPLDPDPPEPIMSTAAESTDRGDYTYGLEQVNAPQAWDVLDTQGDGASVAVLDTGANESHPDLYVDRWEDFTENADEPEDDHGHGTHVSGTIIGGNASGTHIGVAPGEHTGEGGPEHYVARIFTSDDVGDIEDAWQWAVDQDADIMSNSWGASGVYDDDDIDMVRNAMDAGTLPVMSSGNDGVGSTGAPANVYDGVSVGATMEGQLINPFSTGEMVDSDEFDDPPEDWPDEYPNPDVAAPGTDVFSAGTQYSDDDMCDGEAYCETSGTSMAAPHVSGIAALYVSHEGGNVDPYELEDDLRDNTWTPADHPGPEIRWGQGITDARMATDNLMIDDTEMPDAASPGEEIEIEVTLDNTEDLDAHQDVEYRFDVETVTIGIVDDENAYGEGVENGLLDLPGMYETEHVASDDESIGEHEVYVVQDIDEGNVADFIAETEDPSIGVVYLEQWGDEGNAIQDFAQESADVDGTTYDEGGDDAVIWANFDGPHPVIAGWEDLFGVLLHQHDDPVIGPTTLYTARIDLAGDSEFEHIAEVGWYDFGDGSYEEFGTGIAVNNETGTALMATAGLSDTVNNFHLGGSNWEGVISAVYWKNNRMADSKMDPVSVPANDDDTFTIDYEIPDDAEIDEEYTHAVHTQNDYETNTIIIEQPGEPDDVTATAVEDTAVADGEDELEFEVEVVDNQGTGLDDVTVAASHDGTGIDFDEDTKDTGADGTVTFFATSEEIQDDVEFTFEEQEENNQDTAMGTFEEEPDPATVNLSDESGPSGTEVTVDFTATADEVAGYQANVTYDETIVEFVEADGVELPVDQVNDEEDGWVFFTGSQEDGVEDPHIAELTFDLVGDANDVTDLAFMEDETLLNDEDDAITIEEYEDGSITVEDADVDPDGVTATAIEDTATADGEDELEFEVEVVDDEGAGLEGVTVEASDDGTDVDFVEDTQTTDADGEATFLATSTAAQEDVEFTFTEQVNDNSDTAMGTFEAGEPDDVTATAVVDTAVADGEDALEFDVAVEDEFGNAVEDVTVAASDDGTDIDFDEDEQQTDEDGEVSFTATSTAAQENVEFTFTEQEANNDDGAMGTFEAGEPDAVLATAIEDTAVADGEDALEFEVTVEDEFGNAVEDVTVAASDDGTDVDFDEDTEETGPDGMASFTATSTEVQDDVEFSFTEQDNDNDDTAFGSFVADDPDQVTATAVEDTATADGEDELEFEVEVLDDSDNPIENVAVEVDHEGDDIDFDEDVKETDGDGIVTFFATSSEAQDEVEFTFTEQVNDIDDTAEGTFEAGEVDAVEIDPAETDDIEVEETLDFAATAYDEHGNEVEDDDAAFDWAWDAEDVDEEHVDLSDDGVFEAEVRADFDVTAEYDDGLSDTVGVTVVHACDTEGGLGDVSDTGSVISLDATLTLQQIAGTAPDEFPEECADLTNDGEVTTGDVTYIQQIIVGHEDQPEQ